MLYVKAVSGFVSIDSTGQPREAARLSLLKDYETSGYALFQLDVDGQDPARALHGFTHALNLGEAFVPPLYQFPNSNLYDDLGMSTLAAEPGNAPYSHPVFGATTALELHTDGTLQQLGEIRTSVLFCVKPADRGGETNIFHAVNAFQELQKTDPELASALMDDRALTKQASVNGSNAICKGPVFAWKNGTLLTRYSVTDRDLWNVDEVERLFEAKRALSRLAQLGSPHYHRVSLGVGQGVILANDKVSHGRTEFSNANDRVRRMLRMLFAGQPQ